MEMKKIIVIGGGASGLMSAYFASRENKKVILLEKNEKVGKKLYVTGKGRCNLTNDSDCEEILSNVVNNRKFLFSAIRSFSSSDTMEFFEKNHLPLKVERGKRVFPVSDKSSDVIKTLQKACENNDVDIRVNETVKDIVVKDSKVYSVITENEEIICDSVIVCTGGISYPTTGSTGDGYTFAKKMGHNIIKPIPALVGLNLKGEFFKKVQGISLKNVNLTAYNGQKEIFSEFGEMLFAHYGVSGPIVLSCSSVINRLDLSNISLSLDFKPALSEETLDNRLIREFKSFSTKNLSNALITLMPARLVEVIADRANVKLTKKCADITAEERKRLVKTLKSFTMKIASLRPIEEAIVTSGGVDVKNINPKTMESKLVKGLFFAGEVLDIDAFTGGFNIQIAFSTGYIAGINA